jgi:isopentenyl-diphosphate Delta-isomerase
MKKDENAEERKKDHIALAFESRTSGRDPRFSYEPMLSAHPVETAREFKFLGKVLKAPIWVSSMTGGTAMAAIINQNLAKACGEFGMGMGLGSCRSLLDSDQYFEDFNVRQWMGDFPLYANLGIAQVEQLLLQKAFDKAERMVHKLKADGLIIHVNPMQEWLQPEGDRLQRPPIEVIEEVLEISKMPLVVKEVGQGFGSKSMERLLSLPIKAVEFGAFGGTNFALLELLRNTEEQSFHYKDLAYIGHTAEQMLDYSNAFAEKAGKNKPLPELIISGGVNNFLDGYYLLQKSRINAVYGQASAFLKHAQTDYASLRAYVEKQIQGYRLAEQYFTVQDPRKM